MRHPINKLSARIIMSCTNGHFIQNMYKYVILLTNDLLTDDWCMLLWFVILYCTLYCSKVGVDNGLKEFLCHVAMHGWSFPGPHPGLCVPYPAFCELQYLTQLSVNCSIFPTFFLLSENQANC